MTRKDAKELFKSDVDSYGRPRHIMKNIDMIYDEFDKEMISLKNLLLKSNINYKHNTLPHVDVDDIDGPWNLKK